MARLTDQEVYTLATQAGFKGSDAVTATAVALAESGGVTDKPGDVNLTEPGEKSVGLWQVNYRPSRDARVDYRDPVRNVDPAFNASSAYKISGGGKSFTPWSTYTSGVYRNYMVRALKAANAAPPAKKNDGGFLSTVGDIITAGGDPFGILGGNSPVSGAVTGVVSGATDVVGGAVTGVLGDVGNSIKSVALLGLFAAAGLALVVGGVWRATGVKAPTVLPVPV